MMRDGQQMTHDGDGMVYATFDRAQQRVDVLKRYGIWPGIVIRADGFALTYDPGDDPAQRKGMA